MKISLIYTSARPQQILSILSAWRKRASDWRNIEVVVVTDEPFSRKFPNMLCYLNTGRKDCVTGWNLAAAHATGDMLVQVSDDLYPPQDWDSRLSSITEDMVDYSLQLPDERGFPSSVFHPVISRGVYEHFGYLYPPDFRSMFCDNWLFAAHARAGFLRRIHEREFWNHRHVHHGFSRQWRRSQLRKVSQKHLRRCSKYHPGPGSKNRLPARQHVPSWLCNAWTL